MRTLLIVLLSVILPAATANGCATAALLFPLTYDLSRTVATDFVAYASGSADLVRTAEVYITNEGWSRALSNWINQNEESHTVQNLTSDIDLFFRSALKDCHGVLVDGERYSPPFHLALFYALSIGEACVCFDELTENMFASQ